MTQGTPSGTEPPAAAKLLGWLMAHAGAGPSPRSVQPTFNDWFRAYREIAFEWSLPVERAVAGGFLADRTAFAFAAGYEAALARLVPSLPRDRVVSFCVTEEGGGHPRAIRTSLRPPVPDPGENSGGAIWVLNGRKRWITAALEATSLLVAATTGLDALGRNRIRLVLVDCPATGVTIHPMPGVPFVPEISHGEVQLDEVLVAGSRILPGDGYADYVKPFRTVEDIHVAAAILGHLLGIAFRAGWPRTACEELLNLIANAAAIAALDPSAPQTHIVLGGFLAAEQRFLETAHPFWSAVDPETRGRWERDSALLAVAGNARARRLEAAWKAVQPAGL